ncbi:hypothetical protein ZIOFF_056211 [Zingiber officinale]|uniref:LOB domain-containing protein n=1 Tax=Zingiber officinale TaxID=94328 RepID=A0A8J5FHU3_ZINOF|nr:hypothetical protein ZIOFF_056211 [Zingiber officinale]
MLEAKLMKHLAELARAKLSNALVKSDQLRLRRLPPPAPPLQARLHPRPYFPANDQHKFLNAHRLFGVSNIIKIIANLDPVQRNDAMRTIIFQSDMRAQDPVGGCYHIVDDLERQIRHCLAELHLVHRQLSICRAQTAAAAQAADLDVVGPGPFPPGAAQDVCVVDPDAVNIYDPNLYSAPINHLSQQQQQFYNNNYFCFDNDVNGDDHDNLNINGANCVDDHTNVDVCDNMLNTLRQQQQQSCMVMGDEEEIKPLVDMFEVRTLIAAADDDGDSFRNTTVASPCHLNGSYHLHGRR